MMLRTSGFAALTLMLAVPALAQDAAPPPPVVETGAPPAPTPNPTPMAAAAPAGAMGAFGSPGQMAISVDLPLTNEAPQFGILHESMTMGLPSSTRVVIMPSLDYFVAPNVSVGGQVGIDYTTTSGTGGGASSSTTILQVEARAGYNIPLGDVASIWPHLGIAYVHASFSGGGQSAYLVPLVITAPLLWHATPHFFLGAGPVFTTDLVAKSGGADLPKTTDFGIQALVGGCFGGT
jgi:hypothetical protein